MRTTHLLGTLTLTAALALGALAGSAVLARDGATGSRGAATPRLSIAQVHDKLAALGYRDIDEIEHERGVYEVRARTGGGERVKLYVDARSGEILRTKSRAHDRDRDGRRSDRRAERDARAPALPSDVMGWYLADSYGRMHAAGI